MRQRKLSRKSQRLLDELLTAQKNEALVGDYSTSKREEEETAERLALAIDNMTKHMLTLEAKLAEAKRRLRSLWAS